MKRVLGTVLSGLLLAPLASAQFGDFLDDYIVKVKPDKRADFDAVCRKMADANRKTKGDQFLAFTPLYGDVDTVMFVSSRQNYAAIETGNTAFESALNEAYGVGGMKKALLDFRVTTVSSHGRLRRRRWDLSVNTPKDQAAYLQILGNARYLRTAELRVKSGETIHFEELAKRAKAAYEKDAPSVITFVSQAVAGEPSNTFYLSTLQPSLAAFDADVSLRKLMGEEEFNTWQKIVGEAITWGESTIYRILPELSNVPKEQADIAPDFWRPKLAAMPHPKPKPAEPTKAGQ